jgi:hypothetical protein
MVRLFLSKSRHPQEDQRTNRKNFSKRCITTVQVDNLDDFEEILGEGDVPF